MYVKRERNEKTLTKYKRTSFAIKKKIAMSNQKIKQEMIAHLRTNYISGFSHLY